MDVCKACLPYPFLSLLLRLGFYWVFSVALYKLSFLRCELAILQLLQPENPDSRTSGLLPMPPVALSFPSRAPPSICSSHWQFWRQGSVFRLSLGFLRGLCKFYYCAPGLHISWVLATSLTPEAVTAAEGFPRWLHGSVSSRLCTQRGMPSSSKALRCTSGPACSVRGAGDGPLHCVMAMFLVFDTSLFKWIILWSFLLTLFKFFFLFCAWMEIRI